MRAVDTNVLVRMLVRDDLEQAKLADTFVQPGAWVSLLVLLETIWVLSVSYRRTPQQLARTLEVLLDHESLVLQDAEVVRRVIALAKRSTSVGLGDLLILEVARQHGHSPLATFDRAFAKLDGTLRLDRPVAR
jgi:predicted nucleic-acid-binding protein